ncbi:MAG: hypothetical protein A2X81_08105 [Desulfobacterales bacterium GWB2_56_26]|nr:MAG: hypothetical protein A2X81_08105 [Desulfobacterales bacterium GWB2_56_26]
MLCHLLGAHGKKNKPIPLAGDGLVPNNWSAGVSDLVYGDCTFWAYFNAGLTTEALIGLDRLCFAVYHLENLGRTSCYTFLIAYAFVFIYNYFKHGSPPK